MIQPKVTPLGIFDAISITIRQDYIRRFACNTSRTYDIPVTLDPYPVLVSEHLMSVQRCTVTKGEYEVAGRRSR